MTQETDVRFSYSAIAEPVTTLFWNNEQFLSWAQEAGYTSAEFFPFKKTAEEIMTIEPRVLADFKIIKSGHVRYNPYATFWKVVTRRQDPLRPGTPLGFYNLAFAGPEISQRSLQKLETVLGNQFHVITYPYEIDNQNPYGNYKNPVLQAHPAVFGDISDADALIQQVRAGKYRGVVWDTFHALEEAKKGYAPLGDWRHSLAKLLEAGVIVEIHAQAGRIKEKYTEVGDMNWLKRMTGENPDYHNELAQMLRMVKSVSSLIPITIEIGLGGLVKAGIFEKPRFMHDLVNKAIDVHQELIDYVRRV
jgi:hypothetical protein